MTSSLKLFFNSLLYKTNRFSDTLSYASRATFMFLPYFDVLCDLLLNRRMATWNLFVKFLLHLSFVAFPFLKIGDDDNTQVDCQTFCSWAKQNCSRVFDGIHCWMRKMLLQRGNSAAAATPEVATVIYCYLLGGGSMVGVVIVMKSHGPRFKPSILPFLAFVLGCPEFNSLAALCVKPTDLPSASCYF